VAGCRARGCVPHVAQNDTNRRSAIDARTTRHPGYAISTAKRKRIEEPFGWMKTVGVMRKTRHGGRSPGEGSFVLMAAAYNLIRIPSCWQQHESVWSTENDPSDPPFDCPFRGLPATWILAKSRRSPLRVPL